ncbi:MAG TPA: methyltransferase domain-containing protein [Caldilineae bacterium]|jgi:ubiquinone/menaquinone biosynthesis C-methylase UbiE|nr:methyltransferase domain-containing protein [Caldilineae bacterium]
MNHRQFFDQAAANWDAQEVEETRTRLREIVAGLGVRPGATVLDVGCGTGVLFPILLETMNGAGRIVGLDISSEMLRRARAKGYPVECVQGDAEHIPLPDGMFDWVICNAVFPHFPDKARALAEICRVLRSPEPAEGRAGGRLVICHTNSRQAINEFHRSVGGVVAADTIPDEQEMLCLLQEAGLGKVEVRDEPDRYVVLACRESKRVGERPC